MKFYIDESGCLGFKKGSSQFLTFSYVNVIKLKQVERAIKRFQKTRRIKGEYSAKELKFSESRHDLRVDALTYLSRKDWEAGIIILEKQKVQPRLRDKPNILYNYTIINHFMRTVLPNFDPDDVLELCVDRRVYYTYEEAFNNYAKNKATYLWNRVWRKKPLLTSDHIKISHKKSHTDCCLQLADYISGAAFHEYERGNNIYLNLIRNKITNRTYLWR